MNIGKTAKEVLLAVIPMAVMITILNFILVKLPAEVFLDFIGGTVLLITGFTLFLLGINTGFLQLGEMIGSSLISKGKLPLMIIMGFILGFVVTFAEPDVQVLAMQIDRVSGGAINKYFVISAISLGVGVFLMLAIIKILFKLKFVHILLISYMIIAVLAFFTPQAYLSVALDAGGVTTGPMTVPFILALGIGISSVIKENKDHDSSFGLVALSSVGPIIAVMLMGVIIG